MNPINSFALLQGGDTEGLLRLLDEMPVAANDKDAVGVSLLMHSLYRGRRDLAEAIAGKKQGLDIFEAASLGNLDKLTEHVRNGVALDSYSKDGFTALHFACYFGQSEAARLLLERGAKVDVVANNATLVMPLHSAASSRNVAAARFLLAHGAPVNARQQAGWVPIHAAAQNGHREMVDVLLTYGADASIANDQGKTAAMVAQDAGHSEIAALLEGQKTKS